MTRFRQFTTKLLRYTHTHESYLITGGVLRIFGPPCTFCCLAVRCDTESETRVPMSPSRSNPGINGQYQRSECTDASKHADPAAREPQSDARRYLNRDLTA